MRKSSTYIIAGAALLVAACAETPVQAQSVQNRVAAVRAGKVRFSYAARPDICGFGDGFARVSDIGTGGRKQWFGSRVSEDVEFQNDCSSGPARVVITRKDGEITSVRSYVGGTWKPSQGVTDLGTVSVASAVDYLFSVANRETKKLAGEAIVAATLADSVDISPRLVAIAENESRPDDVRGQAIFWLGQTPEPARAEYLRKLYARVRSEEIRDKVIFSISQQRDDASKRWLIDLASSSAESIEMRKKALFWAGQTGTPVGSLTAMYDRMKEREMRDQTIFVLSQRKEPQALDKLMDIARNDPDRDMRKKAMFWLGQSKDARVSAFLTDIINR